MQNGSKTAFGGFRRDYKMPPANMPKLGIRMAGQALQANFLAAAPSLLYSSIYWSVYTISAFLLGYCRRINGI